MIGIRKLLSLPDDTRLRKYPRLLRHFEEELRNRRNPRLQESLPDLVSDAPYLLELLLRIAEDPAVGAEPRREARAFLELLHPSRSAPGTLLFSCNTLRHSLLKQTGAAPADWDLLPPLSPEESRARRVLPITLYLDGIRSPFNVGTIFRTAEAFGVERIFLSPDGADPLHRRALRSSMGCIDAIPWRHMDRQSCIDFSRQEKLPLIALETGGDALGNVPFPSRAVLVLGSEELGVSPSLLEVARSSGGVVSIPGGGLKGSINVAVAAGIVLFHWFEHQ